MNSRPSGATRAANPPAQHHPPRSGPAGPLLPAALLLPGVLLFFSTAVSTAWARIAALRTVEPYAFAVYQQLMANFAATGRFSQTIHKGYDDCWAWSGHRSVTFLGSAYLYGLNPGPVWLAGIQIVAVALGVIPAAMLGKRALGGNWGLALGGWLYLLSPPVMALALQDYQDLVFALPLLMWTLWAMRARALPWVALGALLGCMPREECIPLVVACAMVTIDPRWERPWRRWARNVLVTLLVAGTWAAVLLLFFPVASNAHDVPLVEQLRSLLAAIQGSPGQLRLWGLPYLQDFYELVWAPVGLLALLSPLTALPGLALLLLHMTIPHNHGVDRFWGAHAHHMATVLPFVLAATIMGAGRLIRFIDESRRFQVVMEWLTGPVPVLRHFATQPRAPARLLAACVAAGLLFYSGTWYYMWGSYFNLVMVPFPRRPGYWHSAWALVEQLPPDAIPLVSNQVSLAVSHRPLAYTFQESLLDKARDRGLSAGTHMIIDSRNEAVISWAMSMDGAQVLSREGGFLLLGWEPGARDRVRESWGDDVPRRVVTVPVEEAPVGSIPGVAPPNPHPVTGAPIRTGKITGGAEQRASPGKPR